MKRIWTWSTRALTVGLAVRAAFLCVGYLLGSSGIARPQLESAVVAFVLVGALAHLAAGATAAEGRPASDTRAVEGAAWCAASLVLYWPSLWVGLLSDDFVLADRVRRGAFGFVHSEFFRPLPLLVWSGVLRLGGGAVGLHALNVVGHGLVAFLASRLAAPFVPKRWACVGAGLFVLTFPSAVEAVSWAAGIFDVTATLLSLAAVLLSRRYGLRTAPRTRLFLIAISAAALLCKETAVVIPALVALDAWASRRWTRALAVDVVGIGAAFTGVGIVRVWRASAMVRKPITKYLVQRWLFGTVGGLAVPWHDHVVQRWPGIPIAAALVTIVLAAFFFVRRPTTDTTRAVAAAAGWLLLGSAPALAFFFVAPDLQGSRYMYLPAVGYALLLATMAGASRQANARVFGAGAIATLVVLGAVGVRYHQHAWQGAGDVRDAVLRAAGEDGRLRACGTVTVRTLPDAHDGAYVFRNGAEVAFASAGLTLSAAAAPACTFEWDAARAVFTAVP